MPPGVGEVPPIGTLWGTFLDPALEREFVKENYAVNSSASLASASR